MTHKSKFDVVGDKLFFDFEDRLYPVDYCCQCEQFILSCAKEKPCQGTSCNGGGCPDCLVAYEEFWKLAGPLSHILEKACIARRKQEKKDYAQGIRYMSFFHSLGTDWENDERPVGWNS